MTLLCIRAEGIISSRITRGVSELRAPKFCIIVHHSGILCCCPNWGTRGGTVVKDTVIDPSTPVFADGTGSGCSSWGNGRMGSITSSVRVFIRRESSMELNKAWDVTCDTTVGSRLINLVTKKKSVAKLIKARVKKAEGATVYSH